ncbi:MAG: SAM-dependent methyltransferase, partial [Ferruginibacter sp.]
LKEIQTLSFVYRNTTNDITKNFSVSDGILEIKKLLTTSFYNADLYTNTKTLYYTNNKLDKDKIVTKNLVTPVEVIPQLHNKQKNHLLQSNEFYLKELGVSASNGNIKKEMQHKFRQINKYVEIIDGILKNTEIHNNFSVVDMGSGKGYLTFALHNFLQQKNKGIKVKGIEWRDDLVQKCNHIATLAKYHGLQFIKGSIKDTQLQNIDMLIALHACDTATDDAIYKGIKANAKFIICAPCCHKQIRKQMAPTNSLQYITKHGILLERQAEMVTDTIRSLILEANGYKTKIFDFIEQEDTPKNVLIVGTKTAYSDTIYTENMNKVKSLKELFGIKQHYLETLF